MCLHQILNLIPQSYLVSLLLEKHIVMQVLLRRLRIDIYQVLASTLLLRVFPFGSLFDYLIGDRNEIILICLRLSLANILNFLNFVVTFGRFAEEITVISDRLT